MELVSAARDYESREPEASLGGFVDRLSLLSEADEESGNRERPRLADDDARGQGARVPAGHHRRHGGGAVPALALRRGRRGDRGGAAPLLRRHDARASAAGPHRRGAAPRLRRVSGDRAVAVPRRDPAGAGRTHRADRQLALPGLVRPPALRVPHQPVRTRRQGRGGRRPAAAARARSSRPTPTRAKISPRSGCVPACASATRSSASATVIAVEEHNDDFKVTVRFNTVGVKKLLAKYAKLELA